MKKVLMFVGCLMLFLAFLPVLIFEEKAHAGISLENWPEVSTSIVDFGLPPVVGDIFLSSVAMMEVKAPAPMAPSCLDPYGQGKVQAQNRCTYQGAGPCALCDTGPECDDAATYASIWCGLNGQCGAGGHCCSWDHLMKKQCYAGAMAWLTAAGPLGCSCFTP